MTTVRAHDPVQRLPANPVHAAALALRSARTAHRPIAPISSTYGIAGLEAAYAVAELNTQARVEEGRQVVGKKVGLTSRSVQQQLGVDQPDFGVLFDDMEFLSRAVIPTQRLMQPKVEAEVAFVMGQDLCDTEPSWSQFLRVIDWLARTMAERGLGLRAGEVILSGALGPMVPVAAGDAVEVCLGSLGSVTCQMHNAAPDRAESKRVR